MTATATGTEDEVIRNIRAEGRKTNRVKQEIPTCTVNNVNVSLKYRSSALKLFKSSLEKSCQDPIFPVLNATQLQPPGYSKTDQVEIVEENDISFHKSCDNEEEDSESAVAEEDLLEIFKEEEAESTDSAPQKESDEEERI